MRLAVKTGTWSPSPAEWQAAVAILERCEPLELQRIMRLKVEDDRKRSLTGRLLLRYAGSVHAGVDPNRVRLARTAENKPICLDIENQHAINVSHHGDWVVLASDLHKRVGVDVMRYDEPRRGRETFFNSMRSQFTANEWAAIGTSLQQFYRFWALKESYIKGIGLGLGFSLQRANFIVDGDSAVVEIDGKLDQHWNFRLSQIDDLHCVAVALGPTEAAGTTSTGTPSGDTFEILDIPGLLARYSQV